MPLPPGSPLVSLLTFPLPFKNSSFAAQGLSQPGLPPIPIWGHRALLILEFPLLSSTPPPTRRGGGRARFCCCVCRGMGLVVLREIGELPGPGGTIKESSRALWRAGPFPCIPSPSLSSFSPPRPRGGGGACLATLCFGCEIWESFLINREARS